MTELQWIKQKVIAFNWLRLLRDCAELIAAAIILTILFTTGVVRAECVPTTTTSNTLASNVFQYQTWPERKETLAAQRSEPPPPVSISGGGRTDLELLLILCGILFLLELFGRRR